MASRVEIAEDCDEQVRAAVEKFFDERLGPDIVADARRYCPKSGETQERESAGQLRYHHTYRPEDDDSPGSLVESIEHHLSDDGTLIVKAYGNDKRLYAVYLENGHRIFHPSTGIVGPEVAAPRPFLRPALFQERGE